MSAPSQVAVKCPNCWQAVGLPPESPEGATFQCPLCRGYFRAPGPWTPALDQGTGAGLAGGAADAAGPGFMPTDNPSADLSRLATEVEQTGATLPRPKRERIGQSGRQRKRRRGRRRTQAAEIHWAVWWARAIRNYPSYAFRGVLGLVIGAGVVVAGVAIVMFLLSLISLTIKLGVLIVLAVCLLLGSIGGVIRGTTLTILGYRTSLGDFMPLGSDVLFFSSEAIRAGFLFLLAFVLPFPFVLPGIFLTRAFAATGIAVGLPIAALGLICWARLIFAASASVAEGLTLGQSLGRSIELTSGRVFRVTGAVLAGYVCTLAFALIPVLGVFAWPFWIGYLAAGYTVLAED